MRYSDIPEGDWDTLFANMRKDAIALPCVGARRAMREHKTLRSYLMSRQRVGGNTGLLCIRGYLRTYILPRRWYAINALARASYLRFTKAEVDATLAAIKRKKENRA